MRCGRVYIWQPDPGDTREGRITQEIVSLAHLETARDGDGRLVGRYVLVRNGGEINEPGNGTGELLPTPIGDARANAEGDFLFHPGIGGGRMDKVALGAADFRQRYIDASHFGETNSYYHLDKIASYLDGLLGELGEAPLPRVVAVVNAHHAATERGSGRDGIRRGERWLPFQGGHYRLPSHRYDVPEYAPISPHGEIHLGPGRQLLEGGALVKAAGRRYRANASHNAGILYHEYGHHITRHTADFRANALRHPDRQDNRKTALDEGTCDYWAATMLGTPHIWAWHQRHDSGHIHRRSLASPNTMAEYDSERGADPHANGTIWGAAFWDLRTRLVSGEPQGAHLADLLVLASLIELGRGRDKVASPTVSSTRRARAGFAAGLAALLAADKRRFASRYRPVILEVFAARGIHPKGEALPHLLKRVGSEEIPASEELLSSEALEARLAEAREPAPSVIAGGDIMLGGRSRNPIAEHGADYPFAAVRPLLQRAPIVVANLEGPLARHAKKESRNYSYRVHPKRAPSLLRAGVNVVTLANNHLLDCGRAGVLETLETLAAAGVSVIGAGVTQSAARKPVILQAGPYRVGLLGYYWNRRTAATSTRPGSAMDTLPVLASDIGDLRARADRIVVTFHWGFPYERQPFEEDRAKARFAVECGADVVIGHHPHVIQPLEVYRGCLIAYSLGNFAFGSGNSHAESLLLAIRFEDDRTVCRVYPMYVKNRDPRVAYQPKILQGASAARILNRLAESSGLSDALDIGTLGGTMILPRHNRDKDEKPDA